MLSPNPAVKFTYQDYLHTPDDQRYELLDGELIMAPAPNLGHQGIDIRLGSLLHTFAQEKGLGEVFSAPCDVVLSDTDVVQPDLLFVSTERAHLLLGGANVLGAPDLVVEILSPSTAGRDRTLKRALYAKHGVKEYWLADPEARTVTVLRLGEDAFEVESHLRRGADADLADARWLHRGPKRNFRRVMKRIRPGIFDAGAEYVLFSLLLLKVFIFLLQCQSAPRRPMLRRPSSES